MYTTFNYKLYTERLIITECVLLSRWEMEGKDCDVVTGVQVRDRDVSLLVLEGPGHGAIYRLWTRLPRHSSQGLLL